MGNALFIVWRETIEAMLVIGILHGWLSARPDARAGFPWLWGGIAAGLGLAVFLAVTIMDIQSLVSANALEWFQAIMPLAACGLIFQMVWWMRRHGAGLKKELEAGMASAADRANWLGIAVLAAVAVGREGAETVLFVGGALTGSATVGPAEVVAACAIGVLLGVGVGVAIYGGLARLPTRHVFTATNVLIAILAGSIASPLVKALAQFLFDENALLSFDRERGGRARLGYSVGQPRTAGVTVRKSF